jgi:hypothetical protein
VDLSANDFSPTKAGGFNPCSDNNYQQMNSLKFVDLSAIDYPPKRAGGVNP